MITCDKNHIWMDVSWDVWSQQRKLQVLKISKIENYHKDCIKNLFKLTFIYRSHTKLLKYIFFKHNHIKHTICLQ